MIVDSTFNGWAKVDDMGNQFFISLYVGFLRRWRLGLTQALSVAGAIWLITEILTRSSESADQWLSENGDFYLLGVFAFSVLWFVAYSYEPRKISFKVPTTSSYIVVKFGNLYDENSDWLIGVNEFFDSQLGQVVDAKSVHGQFISNVFNGDEVQFRLAITNALIGATSKPTTRPMEPSGAFEIGTTAVLSNGQHKAFLVAMSHTNHVTHKANSDVPMVWDAMRGALQTIRNHGNGRPIAMPLIGNGLSGVNIEPQHLLRLIVLALVDFGRKVGLPSRVTIVASEACFEHLDIREIKRDWMRG